MSGCRCLTASRPPGASPPIHRRRASKCWCSRRSMWTSTCSRRCGRGRAGFCSRTRRRRSCSQRSAWSPRERRCSPRRPPATWWPHSYPGRVWVGRTHCRWQRSLTSNPSTSSSSGGAVMSTIAVEALTKRYRTVTAVDHLTFQLAPGRITGFLGPNGAGKSTTIRVLLGLARPTSGRATINGRPYAELRDPLRQVGALLDPNVFHPGRSGWAALRIAARPGRIPRHRVEEVLDLTGLGGAAHRRVGSYSLGMRQRLALAAALLGDPQILILDEPASGLDPEGLP